MVWALIGTLALFLINARFFQWSQMHYFFINTLIGLFLLYFVQGISIIFFYLNIKNILGFMRVLFYILLLQLFMFMPVGPIMIAILGMSDHWTSIREKLYKKHKEQKR